MNINDDAWYHFDDSRVTRLEDPSAVVSPNAYILFYKRKDYAGIDLTTITTSPYSKKTFTDWFAVLKL